MATPHKHAAILSIGDELVIGQCLDTNGRWLADRLLSIGITTVEHATVGDDTDAIGAAIRRLAGSVSLVVSTGGLGPTADDLSREGLAAAIGASLEVDADAMLRLEQRVRAAGREMNEGQRAQARRPIGAQCLPNEHGSAPGLFARLGGVGEGGVGEAEVFCLPGPPREMIPMFEAGVAPRIAGAGPVSTRLIHCVGIGEADAAARLGDVLHRDRRPLVGITVSGGIVTCRVRHGGPHEDAAFARTIGEVRARLEPFVFADAAGGAAESSQPLERHIVRTLAERGETLATVESCTGGLLGGAITAIPGSSDVFLRGWVTYSDLAKVEEVGVARGSLDARGAVSREVAAEMAAGGLARAGSDWCLAVTGVAGPGGGSEEKPVGCVFIGVAARGGRGVGGAAGGVGDVEVRRFRFPGDRRDVRERSVTAALGMLHFRLSGAAPPRLLWEWPDSE